MFVKKRISWTLKSKNRIEECLNARHNKRSCEQPREIEDESVATKEQTGGDVLQPREVEVESVATKEQTGGDVFKQTSYGKLFETSMLLLEEYCSNSTLHGVSYFLDKKRHWLERLWWIAGFVMSMFCCGALIHKVYDNWDHRSIIVSISDELTSVWDIPLPAITICPSMKIQSKEFADKFHLLRKKPNNITDEELKMLLAYNMICDSSRNGNISDKYSLKSVIDFARQLAPSLNFTVRNCTIPGDTTFVCKLGEIMTVNGLCFSFNMLNAKETYSIESTTYSQMDHNQAAQWNLENGYEPNISINSRAYPYRVSGSGDEGDALSISLFLTYKDNTGCGRERFSIALHLPGEVPQWYQFRFHLEDLEDAFIIVKPKVIKTSEGLRLYHPDRRKCYFNADRKLRFLKLYTQRNCELECLSNVTLSLCGCVPHHLLRDANTQICGYAKYNCYNLAARNLVNGKIKPGRLNIAEEEYTMLSKLVENCNCLPPCNSIKYEAELRRFVDRSNEKAFDPRTMHMNRENMISDRQSLLNIAFEESEFMALTRSEVYGTIDFIASCGGLLGLFVGASFLSVLELLYYCSLRLYCTRLNRKRENKMVISTP